MNQDILKFLESTPLKAKDLYDYVKNISQTNIKDTLKILKEIEKDIKSGKDVSKRIDNLIEQNIIETNDISLEIKRYKQLEQQIDEIDKEIKEDKYIPNDIKKILSDISKSVSNKNEYKILEPLIKNYSTETKSIVKSLSALQNAIDETTKISMFEKSKYNEMIKEVISEFKQTGITPKLLVKIDSIKKELETAKTEEGENIFNLENNDEINQIISKSLDTDLILKQYDKTLSKIIDFTHKNNLQESKYYKQLLDGNLTIEDYLGKIWEENKNNTKLLDEIRKLDNELNKQFEKGTILQNQLLDYISSIKDLTKDEEKYLINLIKNYNSGEITKEKFLKELETISGEKNIKLIVNKLEELIDKNELTNKQKILEEKRFDLLEETTESLKELTDNISIKDNPSVLKGITEANTFEEASENLTSKLLDKAFGEGTLFEKLGDKLLKKLKLDKLGSILLKGGKGFFGKLLGIVSKPFSGLLSGLGGKLLKGVGGFLGRSGGGLLMRAGGALTGLGTTLGASEGALGALGGMATGLGSGLASAGTFLATNPVGWAITAALVTGAAGYGIYKWKYGDDKKLIDLLEKRGAVKYHFMGDSEITDWSQILQLDEKQLKSLIHFNDWSDKDEKLLKEISKLSPKSRRLLSDLINKKEAFIQNGELHLSKDAITELQNLPEDDVSKIMKMSDSNTKDLLKSNKTITNKITKSVEKDIKNKKNSKNKKSEGFLEKTKNLVKKSIELSPVGLAYKAYKYFTDDKRELVKQLEKQGILDYNIIGNSEIKNWNAIEQLPTKQIKQLIDFDDWDEDTLKKLKSLYKEKSKSKKESNTEVLDRLYNQGITSAPDLVVNSGLSLKEVKSYLRNKQSNSSKLTQDIPLFDNKMKNNENKENTNIIIQQSSINQQGSSERFVDRSNEFLSKWV